MPLSELLTQVFRTEGMAGYAVFLARMDVAETGPALVWQRPVSSAGSMASLQAKMRDSADFTHSDFADMTVGTSVLVWRVEFDPASGGFYCGADECNVLAYRVLNNPAL